MHRFSNSPAALPAILRRAGIPDPINQIESDEARGKQDAGTFIDDGNGIDRLSGRGASPHLIPVSAKMCFSQRRDQRSEYLPHLRGETLWEIAVNKPFIP